MHEKQIVFDVSGPHAKGFLSRKLESGENDLLQNTTIIRVADVMKTYHKLKQKPTNADAGTPTNLLEKMKTKDPLINATKTMDLRPDQPVVLNIWREQTGVSESVMQLMPSLSALENNEVCEIAHGNHSGVFSLADQGGVNALRFTKRMHKRRQFELRLECRPLHNEGKMVENVKLEPLVMNLKINIL